MAGIVLLLVIFTLVLALSTCSRAVTASPNPGMAAVSRQIATPTPPVNDLSEIGSTDGIFIMGIVIVVITSVPFLFLKKKK